LVRSAASIGTSLIAIAPLSPSPDGTTPREVGRICRVYG
jgi:hypothetical protein